MVFIFQKMVSTRFQMLEIAIGIYTLTMVQTFGMLITPTGHQTYKVQSSGQNTTNQR